MDNHKPNLRAYYRAAVTIAARYALDGRLGLASATINDISGGGVKLTTQEHLPAGSAVALRFTLADPEVALNVRGRVVMAYPEYPRGRFAHGITFTAIDAASRERIVRFVHRLQMQRLQEGTR